MGGCISGVNEVSAGLTSNKSSLIGEKRIIPEFECFFKNVKYDLIRPEKAADQSCKFTLTKRTKVFWIYIGEGGGGC